MVGQPAGETHLEQLDLDANIVLYWILNKQDEKVQIGLMWPRTETSGERPDKKLEAVATAV